MKGVCQCFRTMNEPTKCLDPNCNRPAACRGICYSHYQYVTQLVRKGKLSFDELEKSGKILPAKTRGNSAASWFRS